MAALYPLKMHASEEQEMKKSLDLLRAAAKGHIEKKSCFGCHNQAFPMLAFSEAKKRNFNISTEEIKAQSDFVFRRKRNWWGSRYRRLRTFNS
jgi:hypothetical protein